MLTDGPDTRDLIEGYIAAEPRLDIWRRWPEVTEAEYDTTDDYECVHAAQGFAAYAVSRGVTAVAVRGEAAEHPWADWHAWTRLTIDGHDVDVDFTARQYHDLDGAEWVIDEAWPLVWPAETEPTHPVVGRFKQVTATP